RTLDRLGKIGEVGRLETYLHVREDALVLYGFLDGMEKGLFRALLSVSGEGPKAALAVLSVCEAGELARIIHREQTRDLVAMPGIGKKTAERIILELKDKIDMYSFISGAEEVSEGIERKILEEAASALLSLGLTRAGAEKTLQELDLEKLGEEPSVEDIVREALKRGIS
ncbi:MAG: Holliday junction branch migration protein RuvA, partial [Candidatus Krumholzibacteria bacterium]|nr:Holliday junction branch migration protein RuvA [Candidatus Krumholzibacteria bacterium]